MENKRKTISVPVFIILAVILSVVAYLLLARNTSKISETKTAPQESETANIDPVGDYLLDGYPIDTVPLYMPVMVSASKFFVVKDPVAVDTYFDADANYYNIVFETEADPEEMLSYYRSLMSEVNDEYTSESQVQGRIGKYKVEASHYGDNPKRYGYLQVHLPPEEYKTENMYFGSYPDVVLIDPTWMEIQSGFGYLNQKGGEIEYTRHFTIEKEMDEYIPGYKETYGNESGYAFDEKSGTMKWKSDTVEITLVFSKDHGRIYLMMREPK